VSATKEESLAAQKEEAVDRLVKQFTQAMGTQVSAEIIREHVNKLIELNGSGVLLDEDRLYNGVMFRLNPAN